MDSCVGKILSFLVEPVIKHGAYVIEYENKVQELKRENKKLCEKNERIQGRVDVAEKNYGKDIETEVSSWLEEVKQKEEEIANFLREQDQNGESFKCFPGCMCPNLMWRHKGGVGAENRRKKVEDLITRGEGLQRSPVARDASLQSELLFDSPQYYTTFQSRASVVDDIKNALKDSEVDVIGVHGPGGAGKTTMVKEVAKEAKELRIFDVIVMAAVSKEPNTSKLQEELASQLGLKYKQTSELRKVLFNALLNGKRKILVILDDLWQELGLNDLWQELGLNAIGIPTSGLGDRGCKILLTSRKEEVFRKMNVRRCFPVGYLEEEETWKLFTTVITGDFGFDESIAEKVSKRCGGLPIAIVAVGAALKGKEEAEWEDALHQLEKCRIKYIEERVPEDSIPLKWSYDFLKEEDAKSCFLLCCLFPEDAEISIDDLVRYSFALGFLRIRKVATLKEARNRVQTMVNTLKSSCLLLNGKNKNFVKMHDVIRDLAISITEKKQIEHGGGWPGKQQFIVDHDIREWPKNDAWKHHTAISLRINDDNISFPRGVLHCPLMQTLVLSGKSSPKIPNDFFRDMKAARVLDFENIIFELPSSVLELDDVQMLCLNNCQLLEDSSIIRNLKIQIKILSFEGSAIEELPQEIEKLTRLLSLDLRECKSLKIIPEGVISNLINLEELYVTKSFKNWDTAIVGGEMSNASVIELKSLTQLTVLHVDISTKSYKIMEQQCRGLLKKLRNFAIFINNKLVFDNGSANALEFFDICNIDDGFHPLMARVEKFRLFKIQDMRYLPQLPPSGQRSFCKLIDLDISRCHSMKYLFTPSCVKALEQLKTLEVRDCSIMEQIIGVRDHCHEEEVVTDETIIFSQLEMIYLEALPQFRSFCPKIEKETIEDPSKWITTAESIFDEKVSFPILKKLTIEELPMKYIWNKHTIQSPEESNKVSFSQLKHIEVTQCHNLVNVFPSNMLLQLQNLEILRVQNCPLTLLVEDINLKLQSPTDKFKFIDVFPKLRELNLDSEVLVLDLKSLMYSQS